MEEILQYKAKCDELQKRVDYLARQVEALLLENHELRVASVVSTEDDISVNDSVNRARKRKLECTVTNQGLIVNNVARESACSSNHANSSAKGEKKKKSPVLAASTPVAASVKKKKKVLQAIDTNVFSVRKSILDAKCKNFIVTQANANAPVKITISDANEIDMVKHAFNAAKVSYHEFKLSDEKSAYFLIKGLVGLIDGGLSDVKNELIQQGLPENIELSIFTTSFMRKYPNKLHNTLVRLVTPPKFDVNLLNNIKYISHIGIKFEKFKSNRIIQCKNCQSFGHAAGGCKHNHRCVKCGADHLKQDCPRTIDSLHKLVCCNCGGEHVASNIAACAYYQKRFVENKINTDVKGSSSMSDKRPMTSSLRPNVAVNNTNARKSYAGVVRASDSSSMSVDAGLLKKIEAIYQLVVKHDRVLNDLSINV